MTLSGDKFEHKTRELLIEHILKVSRTMRDRPGRRSYPSIQRFSKDFRNPNLQDEDFSKASKFSNLRFEGFRKDYRNPKLQNDDFMEVFIFF